MAIMQTGGRILLGRTEEVVGSRPSSTMVIAIAVRFAGSCSSRFCGPNVKQLAVA